jgi:hypothetical protein
MASVGARSVLCGEACPRKIHPEEAGSSHGIVVEGTRNVSPPSAGGTLLGLSGAQLRWLGVILLAAGFILFLVSAVLPFMAMAGFMQNPMGPGGLAFGGFGSMVTSIMLSFVLGTIGIVLIGIGAIALRFGLVRPVTGYVVGEASPAIRTAAAALGGGLRDAGFGPAPAGGPRTDVRVKCRNCGYLETEDAEFCSKCGQRM